MDMDMVNDYLKHHDKKLKKNDTTYETVVETSVTGLYQESKRSFTPCRARVLSNEYSTTYV